MRIVAMSYVLLCIIISVAMLSFHLFRCFDHCRLNAFEFFAIIRRWLFATFNFIEISSCSLSSVVYCGVVKAKKLCLRHIRLCSSIAHLFGRLSRQHHFVSNRSKTNIFKVFKRKLDLPRHQE